MKYCRTFLWWIALKVFHIAESIWIPNKFVHVTRKLKHDWSITLFRQKYCSSFTLFLRNHKITLYFESPYALNGTAPRTPDTNLPATLLNVLFGFWKEIVSLKFQVFLNITIRDVIIALATKNRRIRVMLYAQDWKWPWGCHISCNWGWGWGFHMKLALIFWEKTNIEWVSLSEITLNAKS